MRINWRQSLIVSAIVVGLATPVSAALKVDSALPTYKATGGVSGTVKSVGSDTLNNLMALWTEGFQSHYPNVKFSVEGKGSSTAPPALIEATSHFGPMSRSMKSKERDAFEKKYGYKPKYVRVAVDALAVFANKDNPIKCLSLPQLDGIFSKTRKSGSNVIETWGDLGLTGQWASKPISLYGRNSASGTYGYFKKVALFKGDYSDAVKEQPGSSAVVQGIASDKYAIGYSGIGYKTADVLAVPIAKKTGAKCYTATAENAYSGNYSIARFLYIYVNKNPNRALDPVRAQFIKYIYSKEGQQAVIRAGFFPVNASLAKKDLAGMGLGMAN